MTSPTGGRVTVFQHTLPTIGPGAVSQREVQTNDKKADASLLGPQTDFYKKLALDCSGQQVAVDVWTLSGSYVDLATLSGMFLGILGYFLGHFSGQFLELFWNIFCDFKQFLCDSSNFKQYFFFYILSFETVLF